MADETDITTADETNVSDLTDERSADHANTAAGPDPDAEPDATLDPEGLRYRAQTQRSLNVSTAGRLVVHFELRDVEWTVDGKTAMRLLGAFSGNLRQADVKHPAAVAQRSWIGVDLERAMAMTWTPDPATSSRTFADAPSES